MKLTSRLDFKGLKLSGFGGVRVKRTWCAGAGAGAGDRSETPQTDSCWCERGGCAQCTQDSSSRPSLQDTERVRGGRSLKHTHKQTHDRVLDGFKYSVQAKLSFYILLSGKDFCPKTQRWFKS